jgi:hypothetical protein
MTSKNGMEKDECSNKDDEINLSEINDNNMSRKKHQENGNFICTEEDQRRKKLSKNPSILMNVFEKEKEEFDSRKIL